MSASAKQLAVSPYARETDGLRYVRCANCREYVERRMWSEHTCLRDYAAYQKRCVEQARALYVDTTDDIAIDDDARLSIGCDGVWVSGWLFVAIPPQPETEEVDDEA